MTSFRYNGVTTNRKEFLYGIRTQILLPSIFALRAKFWGTHCGVLFSFSEGDLCERQRLLEALLL